MKKLLALAIGTAALAITTAAAAHPLGNFTINRYSQIEASGSRLYVLYVLDLAEIPTFQTRRGGGIDADAYAQRIAANVALTVNGRRVVMRPIANELAFPPGAGGLRTTRLQVVLRGPRVSGRARIAYSDHNYAARLGWKEIVVAADHGAAVLRSSAPARSRSQALRAYPKDLLSSPLDVTSANATLQPGQGRGVPPQLTRGPALQAPDRIADSGFASLVRHRHLDLLVVLVSLGLALFWGAAHALGPGHGKSIVTAYLIGQRGTVRHAVALGGIVTVTHTAGVFALGLITLLLSEFVVPDQLYPWLNLAAGLMVVTIGAGVLRARIGHRLAHRLGRHNHHHHDHDHHSHDHPSLSARSLIAVGVSGGLLPCPSALVVLLAAISLHRVAFGLALVVAFSLGLALTITGIGLTAVVARRIFSRVSLEGRLVRALPAVSALAILVTGVLMTARALPKVS